MLYAFAYLQLPPAYRAGKTQWGPYALILLTQPSLVPPGPGPLCTWEGEDGSYQHPAAAAADAGSKSAAAVAGGAADIGTGAAQKGWGTEQEP